MPMLYNCSLATAGSLTTNGTTNTESGAFFVKAGASRSPTIEAIFVIGKATALTSISSIAFRLVKWGTASTGGTGVTGEPVDPGFQAHIATMASRPSVGSTRKNHLVFGCGAGGNGGWVAPNIDNPMKLVTAGALSMDMIDVAGTVSLTYETSWVISE